MRSPVSKKTIKLAYFFILFSYLCSETSACNENSSMTVFS